VESSAYSRERSCVAINVKWFLSEQQEISSLQPQAIAATDGRIPTRGLFHYAISLLAEEEPIWESHSADCNTQSFRSHHEPNTVGDIERRDDNVLLQLPLDEFFPRHITSSSLLRLLLPGYWSMLIVL